MKNNLLPFEKAAEIYHYDYLFLFYDHQLIWTYLDKNSDNNQQRELANLVLHAHEKTTRYYHIAETSEYSLLVMALQDNLKFAIDTTTFKKTHYALCYKKIFELLPDKIYNNIVFINDKTPFKWDLDDKNHKLLKPEIDRLFPNIHIENELPSHLPTPSFEWLTNHFNNYLSNDYIKNTNITNLLRNATRLYPLFQEAKLNNRDRNYFLNYLKVFITGLFPSLNDDCHKAILNVYKSYLEGDLKPLLDIYFKKTINNEVITDLSIINMIKSILVYPEDVEEKPLTIKQELSKALMIYPEYLSEKDVDSNFLVEVLIWSDNLEYLIKYLPNENKEQIAKKLAVELIDYRDDVKTKTQCEFIKQFYKLIEDGCLSFQLDNPASYRLGLTLLKPVFQLEDNFSCEDNLNI